jgi:uncharacterized protein with NRDE domain
MSDLDNAAFCKNLSKDNYNGFTLLMGSINDLSFQKFDSNSSVLEDVTAEIYVQSNGAVDDAQWEKVIHVKEKVANTFPSSTVVTDLYDVFT